MKEITSRKRAVLDEKIKKLTEKWETEFRYTCYATYLNEEEKKNWKEQDWKDIQSICEEIEGLHWEKDREYLKRFQAKAFYHNGSLYAEKGDYDQACEFLNKGKDIMEELSLQYIIPEYYIRTYLYLAKSYVEKHHDRNETKKCLKKAEAVLKWMSNTEEGTEQNMVTDSVLQAENSDWDFAPSVRKQLEIELDLQWIIIESNIYDQDRSMGEEIDFTSYTPEHAQKRLEEIRKKLDAFEKKHREERDIDLWIRRQNDTYWSSGGVFCKCLYFSQCESFPIDRKDIKQNSFFGMAFKFFLKGAYSDINNTICTGNIAALLYDYKEKFLTHGQTELPHWMAEGIKKVLPTPSQNSIDSYIRVFLDKTLDTDWNNMFALSLKSMYDRKEKKITYPYLVLHHSTLRRCFKRLDHYLKSWYQDSSKPVLHDGLRKLKTDIVYLYMVVAEYMNGAVYPRDAFKNLTVGHYTKSWVLPKLINKEGDSRIRIQNVKHLNDPSEGALFMKYVNGKMEESAKDKNNLLIRDILKIYDYKQPEKWNQRSSVYMGCFSSRIDQLNMWSRYGEQGKGCCLCIDAAESFDEIASVSLAEISTEDEECRYVLEDNKYPLYMVTYLPNDVGQGLDIAIRYAQGRSQAEKWRLFNNKETIDEDNFVEVTHDMSKEQKRCAEEANWWNMQAKLIGNFKDLMEKLPGILSDIQKGLSALEEQSGSTEMLSEKDMAKLGKEISNTIMIILDQVRFLVKDDSYRDEREYRVIQYSYAPKYEDTGNGIPKLYVDIEKELKYKAVWFGPLTQNYASDSAYVLNLRKKCSRKKEGENWDLEVHKSDIPYCC